jgi:hypothetical protein
VPDFSCINAERAGKAIPKAQTFKFRMKFEKDGRWSAGAGDELIARRIELL